MDGCVALGKWQRVRPLTACGSLPHMGCESILANDDVVSRKPAVAAAATPPKGCRPQGGGAQSSPPLRPARAARLVHLSRGWG
jgi:hypothetical protein